MLSCIDYHYSSLVKVFPIFFTDFYPKDYFRYTSKVYPLLYYIIIIIIIIIIINTILLSPLIQEGLEYVDCISYRNVKSSSKWYPEYDTKLDPVIRFQLWGVWSHPFIAITSRSTQTQNNSTYLGSIH